MPKRKNIGDIQRAQGALMKKIGDVELAIQQAKAEVAREVEAFMQMHLYARPDKPTVTMSFNDWQKLRRLLSKYMEGK